jgi:hypothetical protein
MTTPAEIDTMLARYRALDERAPEEIRTEWHQITELLTSVATADVASKAQQNEQIKLAYGTAGAVKKVTAYVEKTCGVTFTLPVAPQTTTPPVPQTPDTAATPEESQPATTSP